MSGDDTERNWKSIVNRPVPPRAFLTIGWVTVVVFLTVALTEFRLGSLYHMALALGLAVLVWSSSRRQDGSWGIAALLLALLVFGVFRALTGFTLLRPA
jgi:hypothetical protein